MAEPGLADGHVLVIVEWGPGGDPHDGPEEWDIRCPHPTETVCWTSYGYDDGAEEQESYERHLAHHACTRSDCWGRMSDPLHRHDEACQRLWCELVHEVGEVGWYLCGQIGYLPPGEYPVEWQWADDERP